jgi:hypothetical protein
VKVWSRIEVEKDYFRIRVEKVFKLLESQPQLFPQFCFLVEKDFSLPKTILPT